MFSLKNVDPSWLPLITKAMKKLPEPYLETLQHDVFLPHIDQVFNAFSLPISKVNYILFGETPYPRAQSANGYAFWDASVDSIWSQNGMSKSVNRATSLRNFFKMLLVADHLLTPDETSQLAIIGIDKKPLIQDLSELFENMMKRGFLLLNASLVFRQGKKQQDGRAWLLFMDEILSDLIYIRPQTQLILLGKIAETLSSLPHAKAYSKIIAEHPYNHSFITNTTIQDFFRPFKLLHKK